MLIAIQNPGKPRQQMFEVSGDSLIETTLFSNWRISTRVIKQTPSLRQVTTFADNDNRATFQTYRPLEAKNG